MALCLCFVILTQFLGQIQLYCFIESVHVLWLGFGNTKNPSLRVTGQTASLLAAIIQTFVHYKLNILWTLFVARLHCKFSKVSMFEYNFNFVKTFLIWCFQDFTKSKFIQMNFIYLKHEFSNILRCCGNSWDIYYYSRYFLCLKKYPTLTLLRYIFRESCKSSLQSKDIPNSFFVFLTNFYILYFPKT